MEGKQEICEEIKMKVDSDRLLQAFHRKGREPVLLWRVLMTRQRPLLPR